jgi:Tol biopolymer transport system component
MNKNHSFCKYLLLFIFTLIAFSCGGGGEDSSSSVSQPLTPPGDIAFESSRSGGTWNVYVMHEDGTGAVNVTDGIGGTSPNWSADGMKLTFSSNGDDIYTLKWTSTGKLYTNLTMGFIDGSGPIWSPNGLYIVYNSSGCIFQSNLASSRSLACSANPSVYNSGSSYKPDGSTIAFISNRTGHYEIYTMDNNGANQVNLTSSTGNSDSPSWSPDGTKIVFVSDRDGNNEIYVMNSDGSGQTNISNNPGPDEYPVWRR